MLGDNLYPDGDLTDVVAKFERPYVGLLERGVKFYAVLGNHDLRKGRTSQPAYRYFNMNGHAYYSFTRGDGLAEFFALDSNDFGRTQKSWLESSLSASQAKWKIAFFHHPIYSSAKRHGSNLRLRAELEPLLLKYHVDFAFSGHDHTYERIKPQQGVQYFVSGTGGKLRRNDLNRRSLFFAAGDDQTHSFISVEVTPEQLSYKTIDVSGRVLDEWTNRYA
jgi:3',5'-cyclic AMP phosphodiesterase CpdA